jgi:hypothetical protein
MTARRTKRKPAEYSWKYSVIVYLLGSFGANDRRSGSEVATGGKPKDAGRSNPKFTIA